MQINISELRNNYNKLMKSLDMYEKDCFHLYNELKQAESAWVDAHATRFFREVAKNQVKVEIMQEEMKKLASIYDYFVKQYESLGKKISFDLNKKKQCFAQFDYLLSELKYIIQMYEGLDFCEEGYFLENEKKLLKKDYNALIEIRNDLKKKLNQIEEVEHNIELKLSKMNIQMIKEIDDREFLGDVT